MTHRDRAAYDRNRRPRQAVREETPNAWARRIGLVVRGGEFYTWAGLLDFAVRAYENKRSHYGISSRQPGTVPILRGTSRPQDPSTVTSGNSPHPSERHVTLDRTHQTGDAA